MRCLEIPSEPGSKTLITERELKYFEELADAWDGCSDPPDVKWLWKQTGVRKSLAIMGLRLEGKTRGQMRQMGCVCGSHNYWKNIKRLTRASRRINPLPPQSRIPQLKSQLSESSGRVSALKEKLSRAEAIQAELQHRIGILEKIVEFLNKKPGASGGR